MCKRYAPETQIFGPPNKSKFRFLTHSVETPSMVDHQWNMLYWRSKCNYHTVWWGAVGCEWGTNSVYFGINYVLSLEYFLYLPWGPSANIIKSPQSGVTLCLQFVSTASASAAATTFASHVKTVWAKPYIFGTKNKWVWGNALDDPAMTLTQGHGCGIN